MHQALTTNKSTRSKAQRWARIQASKHWNLWLWDFDSAYTTLSPKRILEEPKRSMSNLFVLQQKKLQCWTSL